MHTNTIALRCNQRVQTDTSEFEGANSTGCQTLIVSTRISVGRVRSRLTCLLEHLLPKAAGSYASTVLLSLYIRRGRCTQSCNVLAILCNGLLPTCTFHPCRAKLTAAITPTVPPPATTTVCCGMPIFQNPLGSTVASAEKPGLLKFAAMSWGQQFCAYRCKQRGAARQALVISAGWATT